MPAEGKEKRIETKSLKNSAAPCTWGLHEEALQNLSFEGNYTEHTVTLWTYDESNQFLGTDWFGAQLHYRPCYHLWRWGRLTKHFKMIRDLETIGLFHSQNLEQRWFGLCDHGSLNVNKQSLSESLSSTSPLETHLAKFLLNCLRYFNSIYCLVFMVTFFHSLLEWFDNNIWTFSGTLPVLWRLCWCWWGSVDTSYRMPSSASSGSPCHPD